MRFCDPAQGFGFGKHMVRLSTEWLRLLTAKNEKEDKSLVAPGWQITH